jgi:peptidylprolyl isomerase
VSTAPAGVVALANVPAVTGGTDLGRQPVVAAGATIPATLVVRDLVVGSGAAVGALATVDVKYVGTLFSTGAVFDASWGRATSAGASVATFALSGVIPGFADGIVGMKRGGRREIVVPPRLGYGANATGSISPNSTLVFIVDLVSFSG